MPTFPLKIITQEKVLFKEDVESLTVTTIDGEITVLPHHIPYVSILKPSEAIIKMARRSESFALVGGILEVTPEKAVILADSAIRTAEIDEEEAKKVKEKAESIMAKKLEGFENAEAAASLERALLHLRLAQKHRTKHRTDIGSEM